MRTTFVSAYMTIYDQPYQNKDRRWRFAHFEKLCKTGIPLAVFCSRDCIDEFQTEILDKYSNVKLVEPLDLSETWTYKTYQTIANEIEIDLPNTRCAEKDTVEYLLLMNTKTEFIKRAIEKNPFDSTHFAWIDFNIFHVFGNKEDVASKILSELSQRHMSPNSLTLPGCWGKEHVYEGFLINDICWRFCGGFFIGGANRMLDFHGEYEKHFENFLRNKRKLVWEVNFWAYLEMHHGLSVVWYNGDHNVSILKFDAEYMSFSLSDTVSFQGAKYKYEEWDGYHPTSTAYVCHKGKHVINTRLVNYWLHPNGAYHINDAKSWIRTRNMVSLLDTPGGAPENFREMVLDEGGLTCHGGSIYGLEDIRLYTTPQATVGFIATNINYSGTGRNRMIRGIYDVEGGRLHSCKVLVPPNPDSWCEKNWIPLVHHGIEKWIYKWWPFEIGVLQTDAEGREQLVIETSWEHSTPLFSKVRGSTPFLETEDGWLGVVHFSYEGHPRRYFHMLILLDKTTLLPVKYSEYFVFRKVSVEFCIGFTVEGSRYRFWISNFDRDPEVILIDRIEIPLVFAF